MKETRTHTRLLNYFTSPDDEAAKAHFGPRGNSQKRRAKVATKRKERDASVGRGGTHYKFRRERKHGKLERENGAVAGRKMDGCSIPSGKVSRILTKEMKGA